MSVFTSNIAGRIKDLGVKAIVTEMMEDQKAKIHVAAGSMAKAIAEAVSETSSEEEKIALIRKMLDPIRFEEDKSGCFFVYRFPKSLVSTALLRHLTLRKYERIKNTLSNFSFCLTFKIVL